MELRQLAQISRSTRELSLATISDEASFARLAGDWNRLVGAVARPSPFLLHEWLLAWWRHFGDDAELAVHVAFRDGRLVAALPLEVRSRLGLRVARFLGGRQSVLGDLLLEDGEDPVVGQSLAEHAARTDCDLVDLYGLPAGSRLAMAVGPSALRLVPRLQSPVLDLSPGWETVYEAKFSTSARRDDRRCRRRLDAQGRLEVTVARTRTELEHALSDAVRLHKLRWDARRDTSQFATPRGIRFHREAILELAKLDVPRIVVLRLDGRTIAYNCSFALAGRMFGTTTAYDPAFARFSPGWLAMLETLASAARDGLQHAHLLGDAEGFKVQLADVVEPLYQGLGLTTSGRGRAAARIWVTALELRTELKRSPAARRLYYGTLMPLRERVRQAAANATGH